MIRSTDKPNVQEAVKMLQSSPYFKVVVDYLVQRYETNLTRLLQDETGDMNVELYRGKTSELLYVLKKMGVVGDERS